MVLLIHSVLLSLGLLSVSCYAKTVPHPCTSVACNNSPKAHSTDPIPPKELVFPHPTGENEVTDIITMVVNRTCAIIKPDSVLSNATGEILHLIELNDFKIVRMEQRVLSREQLKEFYAEHEHKPFYKDMMDFMTSGPVVVLELSHNDADVDTVVAWRSLMGSSNPVHARVGSLRYMFGTDIKRNAVHGSDTALKAERELALFFPEKQK